MFRQCTPMCLLLLHWRFMLLFYIWLPLPSSFFHTALALSSRLCKAEVATMNNSEGSWSAKTAEIMSRYRPIAPRPALPSDSPTESSVVSERIRNSPYLKDLWSHIQGTPTKIRRRSLDIPVALQSFKKQRTTTAANPVLSCPSSPCHLTTSPAKKLSLDGFTHHEPMQLPVSDFTGVGGGSGLENHVTSSAGLVNLPPLQIPVTNSNMGDQQLKFSESNIVQMRREKGKARDIDLNTVVEILEEDPTSLVIVPQSIYLVGSSIIVECVCKEPKYNKKLAPVLKTPREIEEEIESYSLPAVITDSQFRVRMVNCSYNVMVDQPNCSWFNSIVSSGGSKATNSCRKVSGNVVIHLPSDQTSLPEDGFACWVKIEWGKEDKKRRVRALCDVIRIDCKSKDYCYIWRFHAN